MPSNQSSTNKHSRDSGKMFESHIETACEYYRMTGQAEIEKTPEARTVVGRTGDRHSQMICVNAKKSQPDFKGTISGGKSVVFEAKHTDTDRIEYSRVTESQRERLDKHNKMGADCFILVSFGFKVYARIPYDDWENMKKLYGRKYITAEDAKRYKVTLMNGIICFLD